MNRHERTINNFENVMSDTYSKHHNRKILSCTSFLYDTIRPKGECCYDVIKQKCQRLKQKPDRRILYDGQWTYIVYEIFGDTVFINFTHTMNYDYFAPLLKNLQNDDKNGSKRNVYYVHEVLCYNGMLFKYFELLKKDNIDVDVLLREYKPKKLENKKDKYYRVYKLKPETLL